MPGRSVALCGRSRQQRGRPTARRHRPRRTRRRCASGRRDRSLDPGPPLQSAARKPGSCGARPIRRPAPPQPPTLPPVLACPPSRHPL